MKKILVAVLVAVVGLAFTVPASALENEFGGYWRTRMFTQDNFTGNDLKTQDVSRIDTRTRLYYTAVLNDNLKFVNKFEWNTVWGDNDGGDLGADAANNFLIKNSYGDATLGMVNAKIGQQGLVLARGFIMDDDYSGINLTVAGSTSLVYVKIDENDQNIGNDNQAYVVAHAIKTDAFTIVPLALYADLADSNYRYIVGVDVDANLGAASVWGSFYYEGGVFDDANDIDTSAYLLAVGGSLNVSDMVGIHGQVFYATGDDDANDDESNGWTGASVSYYWSEIMGLGTFDNQASAGSCADGITNIAAINLGSTVKLSEKLSVTGDIWYAMLNEDNANGEDKLGTEIDLKASYQLIEGLTLDVVGAYLIADDATYKGNDDANPFEFGTRLSLSF